MHHGSAGAGTSAWQEQRQQEAQPLDGASWHAMAAKVRAARASGGAAGC
jgi:hypothetical protein